jgi:hypothetical protein
VTRVTIQHLLDIMSHRIFEDDQGRRWEVWAVLPEVVERRLNAERRTAPRDTPDRRQQVDIRFRMAPELRQGWLAFQSGYERRRLAPIPRAWETLDDRELAELAGQATPLTVAEPGYPLGAPGADVPPRTDRTTS